MLAQLPDVGSSSQRSVLVDTLYGHSISSIEVKRALCLVVHRLLQSLEDEHVCQAYFILLSEILRRSRLTLSPTDSASIREYVFLHTTLMDVFGVWEGYSTVIFEGSCGFSRILLPSCRVDYGSRIYPIHRIIARSCLPLRQDTGGRHHEPLSGRREIEYCIW